MSESMGWLAQCTGTPSQLLGHEEEMVTRQLLYVTSYSQTTALDTMVQFPECERQLQRQQLLASGIASVAMSKHQQLPIAWSLFMLSHPRKSSLKYAPIALPAYCKHLIPYVKSLSVQNTHSSFCLLHSLLMCALWFKWSYLSLWFYIFYVNLFLKLSSISFINLSFSDATLLISTALIFGCINQLCSPHLLQSQFSYFGIFILPIEKWESTFHVPQNSHWNFNWDFTYWLIWG